MKGELSVHIARSVSFMVLFSTIVFFPVYMWDAFYCSGCLIYKFFRAVDVVMKRVYFPSGHITVIVG